jgi:outer membrane protein insertion porin family
VRFFRGVTVQLPHQNLPAFILLALLLCCVPVMAQSVPDEGKPQPKTTTQAAEILASYEGQRTASVEIAGQPGVTMSEVANNILLHAGDAYSKAKVDASIAAIQSNTKYTSVLPTVEPVADGVRVMLVLQPAYYFGIFRFPGAPQFSYSRLMQVTNYPSIAPYNAQDVRQAVENLTAFYQREGYFQVEVTPQLKIDTSHGLVDVDFKTTLNKKGKFGEIHIAGATPEQTEVFQRKLVSLMARLRGSAIRPGKTYSLKTLTNAADYLQKSLVKQKRLAAQVKLVGAKFNQTTNRADIDFQVSTGPIVNVDVKGAHLWSWTKKSLLPIYQGVGIDPEVVQEGRQSLVSYYQAKGYFDAKVDASFDQKESGDTITYDITKDKKHKVASVSVSGNTYIPSAELLTHVVVEKAPIFRPGKYSEKLVRTSVKNLSAVYESEGYSTVKVVPVITKIDGNIQVTFQITEGVRDVVRAVSVEGADTVALDQVIPGGLKVKAGQPYSQKFVQADRTAILAYYLKSGYLTATFRQTAKAASKNDLHTVDVNYFIHEGPQVHTADVITLGRVKAQQRLIAEDASSIVPGQTLTETQLLTSESLLYDHPGVFDWAEVDLKKQITTQTKEDVLVKVHEAKKNQITYGFGFEIINRGGSVPSGTVALPNLPPVGLPSNYQTSQKTFYGPRATFEYTRNNVRGKGESLSFTAFVGRLDQRGSVYYINPRLRWTKWSGTLSFTGEHNGQNPIFSSNQVLGSYQIQRPLDLARTKTLFLRYSYSDTRLSEIIIPDLVPEADRNVRLSTLSATYTHDTRDNVLDAHKGMLQSVQLDYNTSKLGSSVDFARLQLQQTYFRKVFGETIWANSVRVGVAVPLAGSRVPLSESFFTGGGSTLRGFPLQGAGPQRGVEICSSGTPNCGQFIQVPSGGRELFLLNSELRIPLPIKKGLGVVAFYDGGNVFPAVGLSQFISLYTNTVGAGLRYATPVGPVRIDFGHNLNPTPGIQGNQYFISIGQAF